MGKYPGYEKYKNSGVEWLGEIPEHWEVKRLKNIASCNDESLGENTNPDYEIEYVDISSVSLVSGITHYENITFEKAPSRARRKVKDGDTIVSTVRTYLKSIAAIKKPQNNLIVSTGFAVIRPKQYLSSDYIGYLLQSEGFIGDVVSNSVGVSYPAINSSVLTRLPVVELPLEEQKAIAQFLDHKTKQIDDLIAKKETLIEKLDEKRTALISHAVTKGLDPSAPMKDSGIEWLGEIPKHWEVKRLRYTGSCQNGISKGADYFGFGYPFVNYTDVYANLELPKIVNGLANSTDEDRISYSVKTGDVFFTRTSETIEEIGITSTCFNSIDNATFSGFLIRVRPFKNLILTGFSKYYFRCQLHRYFFVKEMNLVTRASLSQELLKKLPVLLPPLEEQQKIADYLDQKTTQIDQQKAKIQEAIELLKEYRTALITNAVTGKIDVRQVPIPNLRNHYESNHPCRTSRNRPKPN